MEDEILSDQHVHSLCNRKSASDKIIEEILLNENQSNFDVLNESTELVTIDVQKEDQSTDGMITLPIDTESSDCAGLERVNCDLGVLHQASDEGDSEFQIIQKKERRTEHSSHQMHAEHLEDNQSDGNVDLGPESSDLAGIDELGTYSDTNNVLIPKFEVDEHEGISLVSSTTNNGTNVQNSQGTSDIISLPVTNTTATVNPAIVGVAELDGNIVSIGGQHFILFTGVTQTNPVLDGVTTVVTKIGDSSSMLSNESVTYEPAEKKQKTEDTLLPSSVTDIDAGIENLVGFHSPQPNIIEVVEEEKGEGISNCDEIKEGPTDITQAWFTTRDDKYKLQSKGSTWKQGQWSKDEVELLQSNIATYCQENNICDPTEVIFEMSKDERKNFYRTIAVGLNRPLFSVYRRVIRMYDQKNHIGKYSHEEVQKLKELRKRLGTDWAAIGAELGRSASSVKDRCRLMKDQCYTGKWLPEEEKLLTNAVFRLTGAMPGIDVTVGLSWAAVAEQVGTRTEKQCRTKWLNYLNWKQRGGTEWTRADDLSLIDKIANLDASDETHINWEQLSKDWTRVSQIKHIPPPKWCILAIVGRRVSQIKHTPPPKWCILAVVSRSVRSPQWLRGKWWSLKRTVPDYQMLSFSEIVNTLKSNSKNLLRGTRAETVPYAVKMDHAAILQQHQQRLIQQQSGITAANAAVVQGNHIISNQSRVSKSVEASTSSQYIVSSGQCYELGLTLPVTVATDESGKESSVISVNPTHLIQEGSEIIEINTGVEEGEQSVITYTEGGSDSPQPVVMAYPGTGDSSSDSRGITLQQQNPMMSSAVKNDD